MDKENDVCVCVCARMHIMEYYSVIKKNEIMPLAATRTESEIILSKISQKEKDKYHMISFICRR